MIPMHLSIGAAIGPLLAGALAGGNHWGMIFNMLVISDVFSLLFLSRFGNCKHVKFWCKIRCSWWRLWCSGWPRESWRIYIIPGEVQGDLQATAQSTLNFTIASCQPDLVKVLIQQKKLSPEWCGHHLYKTVIHWLLPWQRNTQKFVTRLQNQSITCSSEPLII